MSISTILTAQGRALLAAAVANAEDLASAKIAVGDGNGASYTPGEGQIALVNERWRGPAGVSIIDGEAIFQATVPINVGGFTVREVGLFLGDPGAEQLFIVSQHPSVQKIAAPDNGAAPLTVTIGFSANASEIAVLPITAGDNAILLQSRVPHITVDALLTAPPDNPGEGAMVAIDAGASGIWTGKAGWIAERVNGQWIYRRPPDYSIIRVVSSGAWFELLAGDWQALTFAAAGHAHDDRYYTQAQADARYLQSVQVNRWTRKVAGAANQTLYVAAWTELALADEDSEGAPFGAWAGSTFTLTEAGTYLIVPRIRAYGLSNGSTSDFHSAAVNISGTRHEFAGLTTPAAAGNGAVQRFIASASVVEELSAGGTIRAEVYIGGSYNGVQENSSGRASLAIIKVR